VIHRSARGLAVGLALAMPIVVGVAAVQFAPTGAPTPSPTSSVGQFAYTGPATATPSDASSASPWWWSPWPSVPDQPSPSGSDAPTATPPGVAPTATPPGVAHVSPPKAPPRTNRPPANSGSVVRVASVPALLEALADNGVGEIIVNNGTYHVSPAGQARSDSLWIGARYARRTRPILVRAATLGHVTFDGGGTSSFGCISFEEGAHDQTWEGFDCADGTANETGVVSFGGYPGMAAPYRITLVSFDILRSCLGDSTSASSPVTDHAFYISEALGGPHNLTFRDITVDGRGGLASAFHFYHSSGANRNAWDVVIEDLHVIGTQQAIMFWDPTIQKVTVTGAFISGALRYAVRFEGGTGVSLIDISSSGSGSAGFYSSMGAKPAGVTFVGDRFD